MNLTQFTYFIRVAKMGSFSKAAIVLDVRPLAEAELKSTLCLAVSAHKPVTPLVKRADRMLRELLLARVARPVPP